jgi:hypothetical protein
MSFGRECVAEAPSSDLVLAEDLVAETLMREQHAHQQMIRADDRLPVGLDAATSQFRGDAHRAFCIR